MSPKTVFLKRHKRRKLRYPKGLKNHSVALAATSLSRDAMFDESVAILGVGLMGTAIAAAHLRCGVDVLLYDSSTDSLATAPKRIADELRLQGADGGVHAIRRTVDLAEVVCRKIIIETITEKHKAKKKLYRKLQAASVGHVPYLFSNTSTISILSLAEELDDAWRHNFCGFHFFHPVRERSLLEIVSGRETAETTIEVARQHAVRIGKQPILVRDGPGFLVNRMLNPYLTGALKLLAEGIEMERIERLATEFGMKMGPFRIMDEIGLDVVLHAGWVLFKAFPDRVPNSPLLLKLVELGRLGRKTGRGFMLYPSVTSWDGNGRPDSEIRLLLDSTTTVSLSDAIIVERLFRGMAEEAQRCLDDGIITDRAAADLASVHALGFPQERGGILQWGTQEPKT